MLVGCVKFDIKIPEGYSPNYDSNHKRKVTFISIQAASGDLTHFGGGIRQTPSFCILLPEGKMKMNNLERVYKMSFASVYPHYIAKAEKKGRTKAEVDQIIFWLTGYNAKTLKQHIDKKTDFENFFAQAPQLNPNASKITGVICGYRVEEIEDKLMQKVRYLDKLIDELAKGKAMEKILRS